MVTLISALANNMGVPKTNTQGVQLSLTPLTQLVQQPARAAVIPTPTAAQKVSVVAKLLAINNAKTKEDLEGRQELKEEVSVLQGAAIIIIGIIILGCVIGRLLTIKTVHLASRFFAINGNADLLQKEVAFLGYGGKFSTLESIILPGNWCEWRTKKGGNNNADFDTHCKLQGNVNTFWAPINSGTTSHVDLEAPRVILLPGIFGAYVTEEPCTVHNLFTFVISQSGGIAGEQPRFSPDEVKLILKWCVMSGQADNQGNLLLNVKIASMLLVCRKFGRWEKKCS